MALMLHRINHNLKVLESDGCQLAYPADLFKGLMAATHGDPCRTGCAYFNDGKCPAFLKHDSEEQDKRARAKAEHARSQTDQSGLIGGEWLGMTIRQIAEKEGISLNEARRRKQDGKYNG